MVSAKYFSLIAGLAALAAVGTALPAQADALGSQSFEDSLVPDLANLDLELDLLTSSEVVTSSEVDNTVADTSAATLMQPTEANDDLTFSSFDGSLIDLALESSTINSEALGNDSPELAQITPVSPGPIPSAYLGVGGNLGFVSNDSAVGDWGFAVISKFDLGPRFSVRPSFLVSERDTSFTIPLTFNFNQYQVGGFRFQPYVGVGADVGSSTALLINAGADYPLSPQFTLNTNANFRVTSGFGFGLAVGVGYTIPWFTD